MLFYRSASSNINYEKSTNSNDYNAVMRTNNNKSISKAFNGKVMQYEKLAKAANNGAAIEKIGKFTRTSRSVVIILKKMNFKIVRV